MMGRRRQGLLSLNNFLKFYTKINIQRSFQMRNNIKIFFMVTMWLSFITLLFYLIKVVPIYAKRFAELNLPLPTPTRIVVSLCFLLKNISILLWLFLPLMILTNIGIDFYLKDEKNITRLYKIFTTLLLIIFLIVYISLKLPLS